MSVLALLTSFLLTPLSHADLPSTQDIAQQWNCTLSAQLVGDGFLYMQNNLDSWSGNSILTCDAKGISFSKPVSIVYSGKTYYGNNVNASVKMQLYVTTAIAPAFFQLTAPVQATEVGDQIHWNSETYTNLMHAAVWRENASIGECESLKKGTLYIRDR